MLRERLVQIEEQDLWQYGGDLLHSALVTRQKGCRTDNTDFKKTALGDNGQKKRTSEHTTQNCQLMLITQAS